MTHEAANMTMMKRGSKRFRQGIRGVDDTRNVRKNNLIRCLPFLEGKMLDVDMTSARRGTTRINHQDGGSVVFKQRSWAELRVPEF